MGIMTEAFGWMVGIQKKSIDDLDIKTMEEKLRATTRLNDMWERELKKASKEYADAVSVEANAARSPIARRLSLMRGTIIAKRVKTLTSAVNMLNKMRGFIDQFKLLKQFKVDLAATMELPHGMSLEDFVRQVYALSDTTAEQKEIFDKMVDSLDTVNKTVGAETGTDDIDKLMDELNALYDEYVTKLALNDAKAAEEVRAKIELKKAEMDKQTGVIPVA